MNIFQKEINFDRFVRGLLFLAILAGIVWVVGLLSDVLLPFFIAWVMAYLLNPVTTFIQTKMRLRLRWLSVAATLLLLTVIVVGIAMLIVPSAISEAGQLKNLIADYLRNGTGNATIPQQARELLTEYLQQEEVRNFLNSDNILDFVRKAVERIGGWIWHTAGALFNILSWGITLLYLVFLLLDFERISTRWIDYIPEQMRTATKELADDVAQGMSSYFRGQSIVALLVGILFAIGFSIIDLPLAIGFGLFVGVLNLVPYLQMLSLPIAVLLALLKAAETGTNFWMVLLLVAIVYIVVQAIQDLYIVPKVMGHIMGLSPAIILLSLSVWGSLLGFTGLIIALPLTTLILSYYRRFIIKEVEKL
jgi:predicted PurR-regulated permease PerM